MFSIKKINDKNTISLTLPADIKILFPEKFFFIQVVQLYSKGLFCVCNFQVREEKLNYSLKF